MMVSHIATCLALLLATPDEPYVLRTPAGVWDVAARDLTGDGHAELLALCCDETSYPLAKFLAVFIADQTGGYPAEPSIQLDLAPGISTLFFAETDGEPPVELVAADAESTTVFRFAQDRFDPIATSRFSSLLPSGSKEPLFLKGTAEDLDGDGIDEWILPVPSGYEIRTPDALLAKVACNVVSEIREDEDVFISHRLPACKAFDLDGSPKKCLAFLSDEFADFAYGPDWAERNRFRIPLNLEEKWEASTQMHDIDGSGFPDLIVTQTRGTVNLKAVTHVYVAASPFAYPDNPTAMFEVKGAITSPVLADVNGDDKKDILLISIPFGVRNVINFFVLKKVAIRVDVYLFEDDGFPEKPTFSEHLTLDAPEGRERVVYTMGDFSGDGRLDVAFGSRANKLVIHTGSEKRMASPRPWATLSLPSFGIARSYDLDGNEAKDIVIFHPAGENKKRIEVIVF